jgi:hypothetical protein
MQRTSLTFSLSPQERHKRRVNYTADLHNSLTSPSTHQQSDELPRGVAGAACICGSRHPRDAPITIRLFTVPTWTAGNSLGGMWRLLTVQLGAVPRRLVWDNV